MRSAAFRRVRWERVASAEVVDELEAAHTDLDVDAQIEAGEYADTHSDDDLRRLIAARDTPDDPSGDDDALGTRGNAPDVDEELDEGESART